MICRNVRLFAVVLSLCILVGGGCRSGRNKGVGSDDLSPDVLPGNYGLSERFEDGIRVPPSEFSVEPISFAYDSCRIDASEKRKISKVASFMKSERKVRLVVEGHCDERGSREYNLSLGEHRALAIRAVLIGDEGISSKRIQTRSYGEEKPVDSRHAESAWRKNRRGEFALYR